MKALTPRLQKAHADLVSFANGNTFVEGTVLAFKKILSAGTERTARSLLAGLEAAGVLRRVSGRGPGALVRVVFREAEEAEAVAEGEAEEAEVGRGRGGPTVQAETQRRSREEEKAAAAAARREAEEAEGPRVVVHELGPATLAALAELLRGCVSRGEASPRREAAERPLEPAPFTSQELESFVEERFAQVKDETGKPPRNPVALRNLVLNDVLHDPAQGHIYKRKIAERASKVVEDERLNREKAARKAEADRQRAAQAEQDRLARAGPGAVAAALKAREKTGATP